MTDEYGFDTAHHVLVERNKGGHASIPEALANASLTEAEGFTDEQDAELARLQNEDADESAALAKRYQAEAESKTAMLLRLAQTPEGVTNTAMKELTGWTKLGGFFNAAKKAGLELTRVRENGDTTWRALAKAE